MFIKIYFISLFLLYNKLVEAHSRWKCPPPRDANDINHKHVDFKNTGNKIGPCGSDTGEIYGFNGITILNPGLQTFEWEESIAHKGSPFRINLLNKNGTIIATLLDHIPHNDKAKTTMDEKLYTSYKMSLDLPNIDCEECSLQLLFIMTDKTINCGLEYCNYYSDDDNCIGHTNLKQGICLGAVPTSGPCKYSDTCFSVYHSCIDIKLLGNHSIDNFKGDDLQPKDWPFRQNNNINYTKESIEWNNGWMTNLPKQYSTSIGIDLCSNVRD